MQDGAPCHHFKLLSDFLKKKNIKTLDGLCNSPDLNAIETLRATLKDKVADEHATSAKDLKMAMKRIWTQKITARKYSKHLVIKNKDGYNKL